MIASDTMFYSTPPYNLRGILRTLTPLNNWSYNKESENLAVHGVHPRWLHLLVNLPLLVGPALTLISVTSALSWTAVVGTAILSIFPHQETRFLLPAVSLLIASTRIPTSPRHRRVFISTWIAFNASVALLMGVLHQGGVFPVQWWLAARPDAGRIYRWQAPDGPMWMFGSGVDGHGKADRSYWLRGKPLDTVLNIVLDNLSRDQVECDVASADVFITPRSNRHLPNLLDRTSTSPIWLRERWGYEWHVSLDDGDFDHDGVARGLIRMFTRPGLGVYSVTRKCIRNAK
jgi:phosphatidylinositol glycan class Z